MAVSTAYKKMKTLCLNIRNEILTDIEIHKQDLLPRYGVCSSRVCKLVRYMQSITVFISSINLQFYRPSKSVIVDI